MNLLRSPNLHFLLSFLLGGLAPLALSPLKFWPMGIISVFGLYGLLQNLSTKQAFWAGWFYGFGFFGVGVSWVYVSINVYGNAPAILAALATGLFVACLAFLFSLQTYLYQRFFKHYLPAFTFAAVWVLLEWFRAWFLTGFPWLYLGYGHIETPLSGLAPIVGVMGISFVVALSGSLLFQIFQYRKTPQYWHKQWPLVAVFVGLWIIPVLLKSVVWVKHDTGETITVGIVQANIDQNQKFDSASVQGGLNLHYGLSQPLWKNDVVIWSETAIPLYYQDVGDLLDNLTDVANENDSTLLSGIFSKENDRVFNSIISLGKSDGIYHKQKVVPFGEYQPFESIVKRLRLHELFNLPMSPMSRGPKEQGMLRAGELSLAPFICYEVVFPDFVRKNAIGADFLVTISNDTWFGASMGPLQHLEMAAMRALENGRYMVRATNNGVSAIINEKGEVLSRSVQFEVDTLEGEVKILNGRTPFSRWGSYPILFLCGLLLALGFLKPRVKEVLK